MSDETHVHGQPSGLTWADVDLLREGAQLAEDALSVIRFENETSVDVPAFRERILDLADRLAAQLPSR